MSLLRILQGPSFPFGIWGHPRMNWPPALSTNTIDAAGEKWGGIGIIRWADGSSSKTVSAAGGAKIHVQFGGSVVFADAGSTLRIGLQGFASTGGSTYPQSDGTWSVYRDILGTDGVIGAGDSSTLKAISLSGGTGSVSVTDTTPIAIVGELTARAGTDSLPFVRHTGGGGGVGFPCGLQYTTAWQSGAASDLPIVLLEADDGTFGIFDQCVYALPSDIAIGTSSTFDEYGLIFQVPFRCTANAILHAMAVNSTALELDVCLYTTPLGTPSLVTSTRITGERGNFSSSTERPNYTELAAEQTFEPGVDYCISARGQSITTVVLGRWSFADANHRTVHGLVNCRQGHRDAGTGAFTETTTLIPMMGIRLSAIDDGRGLNSASFNLGMN